MVGIVEKEKLPPPFASTVYELTPAGRELQPVLHELARFGARLIGPPPPDATGFYYLVVDRKLEGVRVEGDVAALEQLLDGFAPSASTSSPLPA